MVELATSYEHTVRVFQNPGGTVRAIAFLPSEIDRFGKVVVFNLLKSQVEIIRERIGYNVSMILQPEATFKNICFGSFEFYMKLSERLGVTLDPLDSTSIPSIQKQIKDIIIEHGVFGYYNDGTVCKNKAYLLGPVICTASESLDGRNSSQRGHHVFMQSFPDVKHKMVPNLIISFDAYDRDKIFGGAILVPKSSSGLRDLIEVFNLGPQDAPVPQ